MKYIGYDRSLYKARKSNNIAVFYGSAGIRDKVYTRTIKRSWKQAGEVYMALEQSGEEPSPKPYIKPRYLLRVKPHLTLESAIREAVKHSLQVGLVTDSFDGLLKDYLLDRLPVAKKGALESSLADICFKTNRGGWIPYNRRTEYKECSLTLSYHHGKYESRLHQLR